jgi:predicted outer membrane repeat protein
MPVYYKANSDGDLQFAGYTSNSAVGYILQAESNLCATSGWAYSSDRTALDLSQVGGNWNYYGGSETGWVADDTFATSCIPTTAAPTAPYMLAAIGTCSLPYTFIDTAATCEAAAVILSLADTTAAVVNAVLIDYPYGCYYKTSTGVLYFNPSGSMTDDDTDRVSLCRAAPTPGPTAAPTIAPTNFGDTNIPTASPTDSPTANANNILNWADLKVTCSDSACDTANGGCTIILSGNFVMGSYTGEIDFSGKAITIWGHGKVLDASAPGRLFKGDGVGSFLELHDAVLQNGDIGTPDVDAQGGGAIWASSADVEIYDSTFKNNTSGGLRRCGGCSDVEDAPTCDSSNDCSGGQRCYSCNIGGGAIRVHQGTMEIYDSTFESNHAIYLGSSALGGAMWISSAYLKIYDTTFRSNTATYTNQGGGAISMEEGTLVIHDSFFVTNVAGTGGAIAFRDGTVEIYKSTFASNSANHQTGGAITAYGVANVEIHDSTFISNSANSDAVTSVFSDGGAIKITGGSLKIYDTTFQSNTAGSPNGDGGAIHASGSQVLLVQTTAVSNTPNHYAGSTFTHQCYDSFYYNGGTATANSYCAQCPAGTYKNFTLNPDALACKECPEGRYGDPAIAQASSSHCPKCPAGYHGPDTSATVCTACPAGRYGQFPGETSETCTAECPTSLVAACTAGTASPQWRLSSDSTWRMLRLRSRDRAQWASSNQA